MKSGQVIAILAIVAGALLQGRVFFDLTSLPGSDAYYYALQTQWLSETGHLKIPDSSPVFRLMQMLLPITASGAGAFLLYSVLSLMAVRFLLAFVLRDSLSLPVIAWLALSPSLFILSYEFPKQLLGFGVVVLAASIMNSERLKAYQRWIGASVLIFVAANFHLSALLGGLIVCSFIGIRKAGWRIRFSRRLLIGAISISIVAGVIAEFVLRENLARFDFGLSMPGLISILGKPGWGALIAAEFLLVMIAGGRFAPWLIGIGCLGTLPALLPLFNDGPMSLGERFALLTVPFAALSLLGASGYEIAHSYQGFWRPGTRAKWIAASALIVAFNALSLKIIGRNLFEKYELRNARYELVRKDLAQLPKPPLLISPLGLNYYLKYFLKIETFPYNPEEHWDKTLIWRLVDGIEPSYFLARLPSHCLYEQFKILPQSQLLLMREDCFEGFRRSFDEQSDSEVFARLHDHTLNPDHLRPRWLYGKYQNRSSDLNSDPRFPAVQGRESLDSKTPPSKDKANLF